jgi:hypothetical protein
VAGIEEKTRGDGQHHVAALCPGSDCMTEMEPVFQSRGALNEWRESLPPEDTAVVVVLESDSPRTDRSIPDHERRPQSDNSRDDSSR